MGNGRDKIFNVNESNFQDLALGIFQFQYQHNSVYQTYIDMLKFNPLTIKELHQIPFLPIQFFKTHRVKTTDFAPTHEFQSSGTTQTINSRHFIKDIELYRQSFTKGFELVYGPVQNWCIIGLLPSYLERKNSSLVFMVSELIRMSGHEQSGFYLYEHEKLRNVIKGLEEKRQKTLLIGVTFALLDFANEHSFPLQYTVVMETGGMKGRKEEIVREEVHRVLKNKFQVEVIHSEYGMTELFSQAYSKGNGIFYCPPWMKIFVRDEEDPLEVQSSDFRVQNSVESESRLTTHDPRISKRGVINIIDFANVYSCSFIATDDAGKLYDDGSFEVIGRLDNSDMRGCNLMTI